MNIVQINWKYIADFQDIHIFIRIPKCEVIKTTWNRKSDTERYKIFPRIFHGTNQMIPIATYIFFWNSIYAWNVNFQMTFFFLLRFSKKCIINWLPTDHLTETMQTVSEIEIIWEWLIKWLVEKLNHRHSQFIWNKLDSFCLALKTLSWYSPSPSLSLSVLYNKF